MIHFVRKLTSLNVVKLHLVVEGAKGLDDLAREMCCQVFSINLLNSYVGECSLVTTLK